MENLTTTGIGSPDHPACSESLYQLHYPSPLIRGDQFCSKDTGIIVFKETSADFYQYCIHSKSKWWNEFKFIFLCRSKIRYLLIFIIAVVIYNEYLSYSLKRWFSWPTIRCSASSNCLKILLVADPQILGEQHETHFPSGSLMRLDSDRWL